MSEMIHGWQHELLVTRYFLVPSGFAGREANPAEMILRARIKISGTLATHVSVAGVNRYTCLDTASVTGDDQQRTDHLLRSCHARALYLIKVIQGEFHWLDGRFTRYENNCKSVSPLSQFKLT